MIVGIIAVVAQAERKMTSARTKAALAAAKARGQKLGGLRPNSPVLSIEHRTRSAAVRQQKAQGGDIAPVIAGLREQGVTTLRGMARELTQRGIRTARGKREWTPIQVFRVLERLAV